MTEPPAVEQYPPFVGADPESRERWRLVIGVTRQIAGWDDPVLAGEMYHDKSIPTYDPPALREDWAKFDEERGRRFGDLKPIGHAPAPSIAPEEMAAKGFDAQPRKGPMAQELLGDAHDTQVLHRPEGDLSHMPPEERYTDERKRSVHDPVVRELTDGKPGQKEPHVVVVAGGPASGKTTFIERSGVHLPEGAVHLNLDHILTGKGNSGIPETRDMLDAADPYTAVAGHREAGDILHKAEQQAIKQRSHIVLDATGNVGKDELLGQLQRYKDAGYKVDMMYVSTPTETAVRQNLHRAETEGRYVPTPVVREKHRRVAANFPHVVASDAVDSVHVYDPEHGLVGFRNGEGRMEATHEEGYARWMAKADEPKQDVPAGRSKPAKTEVQEARKRVPDSVVVGQPFELQSRQAAHDAADAQARAAAERRKHSD